MERLYYAAPLESRAGILFEGILSPREVRRRIALGNLSEVVLGVSFGGADGSNFPEFVSLVSHHRSLEIIAQQLSFARTGNYFDHDFKALVYHVDPAIRLHTGFRDEVTVKSMNPDAYPFEVLYLDRIPREFILDEQTCVRPG